MKTHDTELARSSPPRGEKRSADEIAMARIRRAAAVVRHRQEEMYDRLAENFARHFEASGTKTPEALEAALDSARAQLTAAGAVTHQQGERLKGFLQRDIERTAQALAGAERNVAQRLDPARLEAGALASIASALAPAGDALRALARDGQRALEQRTGEVTSAGTLACGSCGHTMRLRRTGTVPPCPHCRATRFRKGC